MIGLRVERRERVPVARMRADIDAANASHLREELWALLGDDGAELVLDLSATPYLDSAGVDMLFRLAQSLQQRRGTLRLVIPSDSALARLAQIVALPDAVPLHESLADAVAAFAPKASCGKSSA